MTEIRPVSEPDKRRITAALAAREAAEAELRAAILEASKTASVRSLAAFSGLSTNTISRWKRGD